MYISACHFSVFWFPGVLLLAFNKIQDFKSAILQKAACGSFKEHGQFINCRLSEVLGYSSDGIFHPSVCLGIRPMYRVTYDWKGIFGFKDTVFQTFHISQKNVWLYLKSQLFVKGIRFLNEMVLKPTRQYSGRGYSSIQTR